jgi:hypothetical protein
MESVIWCILGFVLIALSVTLVCIWTLKERVGRVGYYSYFIYITTALGCIFVYNYIGARPIHSKDKKLTIEIRQELLNGKIISTDTIYKFTPKKK